MYDCPKWAPANKEMDLLGSLKWLLRGGGRELFLGKGDDGLYFLIVRLCLLFPSSFLFFFLFSLSFSFCLFCLRANFYLMGAGGIVIADCLSILAASATIKRSVV